MYSQIAANKRKTLLIFLIFLVLTGFVGWVFALYMHNTYITPFVILGALFYALITYFIGSKMALSLNGAREITKKDNPRYYRIVENLSIADGLPMPKLYIINDPSPNAFATGRNPNVAAVCATSGLLEIMNDDELQGVFAHELGHVKNYDIRVAMVAFALASVISIIADIMLRLTFFRDDREENNQFILIIGIIAAILTPIIATLIQLAISRRREYLADATGALTTRYPEGLISALKKIERYGSTLRMQNTSTAHFFFANPLKKHSISNLFSTHPPIVDRIKRLEKMETHD